MLKRYCSRQSHLLACFLSAILLTSGAQTARAEDDSDAEASDVSTTAEPVAEADEATPDEARLMFNFRYQPWQDVLDWFADQADLSLLIESPPPGTFNYRDSRSYTTAEALDVLNSVLLTKGYTLVRSGRMLVLVNLEDGIPPNLVPDVPLEELDQRGEHELIRVLFPVWSISPEHAAEELRPLLGPQGAVVILPQARAVQVTETAGRLRTIRSVINAVEQPDEASAGVREFELQYLTVDSAMPTIRQMLGIPDEAQSTPDGSLHITKSMIGEKLLVRGTAQHTARLEEVLRRIDVPEAASGVSGSPQMEVYAVSSASSEAVRNVLETLLADDPTVRLATDPETGYIVAFARPAQHATIRATIEQMQKDTRQVDVISLTSVDPQTAVLAINKLFGSAGEEPDPTAPRVDADMGSRSLLVRGTKGQVEQIRDLLQKLGEGEDESGLARSRQNVRLLPLSGSAARSAVAQIEQIWPSVRSNQIRIVRPAESIRSYRPSDRLDVPPTQPQSAPDGPPASPDEPLWQHLDDEPSAARPGSARPPYEAASDESVDPLAARPTVFRLAASETADGTDEAQRPSDPPPAPPNDATDEPHHADREQPSILIAPGPGGTLIASDDPEALDELEELLSIVAGRESATGREYAVFYLKYSKATMIAEVLAAIFGGSPTTGGDGGLVGDMANAALGELGGALMGDLLLGGGGGGVAAFSSGAVDIVPDARLNALIVRASPADLETIDQLLEVLDQRVAPEEVEADARPRLIPVYNTSAAEVAQVVQEVYHDRMGGGSGAMSPRDMLRMLRGNGANIDQRVEPMSIGIDERSNSLVVRAPDPLFEEVRALVASLDNEQLETVETTRVVSLRHTNPAAVQQAIDSIVNGATTTTADAARDDRRQRERRQSASERRDREDMRRQWRMIREFQRMQQQMQQGGRGRGGRGSGN